MADANDVQRIALTLPEAIQNGSAFELNAKGFAWYLQEKVPGERGRVERPDVLVVRVANDLEKQALLAEGPHKFFTNDHYNGYPAVFVRLPAVEADELTELLAEAWRTRAPRKLLAEFDAKSTTQEKA